MAKHKPTPNSPSLLDEDIIELLAEAQEPVFIPVEVAARMRRNVMQNIRQESVLATSLQTKNTTGAKDTKDTKDDARDNEGFSTLRGDEGEWIEAMPGAYFKVLHDDGNGLDGLLSYLIKLEPGVEMEGHVHPFDEECLMLEGDLTLGDIILNKGDFHYAAAGMTHGRLSTHKGCMAFIRGALPV